MPKDEYLRKYYNSESKNLEQFKSLYKDYVFPILYDDNRDFYSNFLVQKKAPFRVDFEKFDNFLKEVNKNEFNDDELYYYLAFWFSINSFEDLKSFYAWKQTKIFFFDFSFDQMLKMEFGSNYIKSNIVNLLTSDPNNS